MKDIICIEEYKNDKIMIGQELFIEEVVRPYIVEKIEYIVSLMIRDTLNTEDENVLDIPYETLMSQTFIDSCMYIIRKTPDIINNISVFDKFLSVNASMDTILYNEIVKHKP